MQKLFAIVVLLFLIPAGCTQGPRHKQTNHFRYLTTLMEELLDDTSSHEIDLAGLISAGLLRPVGIRAHMISSGRGIRSFGNIFAADTEYLIVVLGDEHVDLVELSMRGGVTERRAQGTRMASLHFTPEATEEVTLLIDYGDSRSSFLQAMGPSLITRTSYFLTIIFEVNEDSASSTSVNRLREAWDALASLYRDTDESTGRLSSYNWGVFPGTGTLLWGGTVSSGNRRFYTLPINIFPGRGPDRPLVLLAAGSDNVHQVHLKATEWDRRSETAGMALGEDGPGPTATVRIDKADLSGLSFWERHTRDGSGQVARNFQMEAHNVRSNGLGYVLVLVLEES